MNANRAIIAVTSLRVPHDGAAMVDGTALVFVAVLYRPSAFTSASIAGVVSG